MCTPPYQMYYKHNCMYSALQVSCLAGVVNEQLSMSLYKLIAFVLCTITELSHCLFSLSSGQLSRKALYNITTQSHVMHEESPLPQVCAWLGLCDYY